jgi:hypothetical protein
MSFAPLIVTAAITASSVAILENLLGLLGQFLEKLI